MTQYLPALVLLISAAGCIMSVRWRFGSRTLAAERYMAAMRSPDSPRVVANLHVAMLPASLGGLALGAGLYLGGSIGLLAIVVWLTLSLVGVAFALRPPTWARAAWLVAAERGGEWREPPMSKLDIAIAIFLIAALGVPLVLIAVIAFGPAVL